MHNRHLRSQVSYPRCKCDNISKKFNQISWELLSSKIESVTRKRFYLQSIVRSRRVLMILLH